MRLFFAFSDPRNCMGFFPALKQTLSETEISAIAFTDTVLL